jgi:hypothetical protein
MRDLKRFRTGFSRAGGFQWLQSMDTAAARVAEIMDALTEKKVASVIR